MNIGIDLGTTYCCIAYKNPKTHTLHIIDNPQKGGKSIPSVISLFKNEIRYNLDALNTKKGRPECCLYDSKRFIGRTYKSVVKNFNVEKMNFQLENKNNKPNYEVYFKEENIRLTPEEISALLLSYLKSVFEVIVDKIEGCVITVPAHFTNIEREATLFAAEMANLKVLQLLNEPSAAAISYGHENEIKTGYILIFDYGGGTLDVSIVHKQEDKYDIVAYDGDQILGGRDIDNMLLDYCIEQFQTKYCIEHNTPKKRAFLLDKCEMAKIVLSERRKHETEIFDWNENESIILSKKKLEEICLPFFEKSIQILERFLVKAKISKSEIDKIVMTGGSSRIPLIQQMVGKYFGLEPNCHDPEAAIAKGAAIVAFDYSQKIKSFGLHDIVRYSIGISVNNQEKKDGPLLYSIIIPSGSKIPCSAYNFYNTTVDNQEIVAIRIAEGESKYFDGNTYIDEFKLENLPPGKAGEIRVEVTIKIDKSGLLLVTATETSKKGSASKAMLREGNFYKKNEKDHIRESFKSLF